MKTSTPESLIDVRSIPPRQKHPAIFDLWGQLNPGAAMILLNDHDPVPLYYQFAAQHGGQFHWEYLDQGPEIWRVRIRKGTFPEPGFVPERPSQPQVSPVHFVEPLVLDVRPLIEKGETPCGVIDQAVASLKGGQPFVLIAPFEPQPLYAKLGREGFVHETTKRADGVWRVEFRKKAKGECCGGKCGTEPSTPASSAKTVYLDVRGQEPPEPLVKALAALVSIPCGTKLVMHSDRKPLHLFEQLEQRGFSYDCTEQADRSFITESGMPAMAMTNPPASVTRLPLFFFAFGLLCLAVFGSVLPFYAEEVLAQHHYTHYAVTLTHLLVLGFLVSVVMGATLQLAPMALGVQLRHPRLGRWILGFHVAGVCGMVTCFGWWNFRWLLWASILVVLGFGLFLYSVFRTLRKVERHDLVSIHIGTATGYMALTLLAGQYLIHDKVLQFSKFAVLSAIHAHAHLAAMGWLVMMMVGISYRLVPMFTLSEIQSTRRAWVAYACLNVGIIGIFMGLLLQKAWLPVPVVMAGTGLAFWLWEMRAIIRARKRPNLDGALKQICIALAHVPPLFLLGLWLSWPRPSLTFWTSQAQTSYGVLAFLGFITLFIIAMLYKIIPFLVWYQIYPPLVGLQPVPKLTDLYSVRLGRWAFRVYLAGVWSTAGFSLMGTKLPLVFLQSSAGLMGLGIGMTVINLAMPLMLLLSRHDCPLRRWLKCRLAAAVHAPLYARGAP